MKKILMSTLIVLTGCVQPYQIQTTRTWTQAEANALSDQILCERTATGLGTAVENRAAAERGLECFKEHKEKYAKIVQVDPEISESHARAQRLHGKRVKINNVYDQVLNDSIDQYEIVERNGSPMDQCVQAGFVKAAALQAKNEDFYAYWNDMHRLQCLVADYSY